MRSNRRAAAPGAAGAKWALAFGLIAILVGCTVPPGGQAARLAVEFTSVRTGAVVEFAGESTGPGAEPTRWSWDFGDGQTGSGQNPTHPYAQAGDYTVVLTTNDGAGATGETTHSITVPERPESSDLALYDDFARYGDGTDPAGHAAVTGQVWSLFSGPADVHDGLWDSAEGTGAAYLYARSPSEITYLRAVFRFDTMGGTRTGEGATVAVMVWDDIASISTRTTRCHLVLTPRAIALTTASTPGGALNGMGGVTVPTSVDTLHTLEVRLKGSNMKAYVDGELLLDLTDPTIRDRSTQREAVFEPYYNDDGVDARVRFAEVGANWIG